MRFREYLTVLLFASFCTYSAAAYRGMSRKTAEMKHVVAAIRDQVNEADVSLINDTIRVLFPKHLIFDFNQAQLRTDFLPIMARFGSVLQQYPGTGILIIGHTDNQGCEPYNLNLSRRRADTAGSVLVRYGVDSRRLDTWGLGSDLPVATNKTEAGRSLNRRVEFVVLYNYSADGGRK